MIRIIMKEVLVLGVVCLFNLVMVETLTYFFDTAGAVVGLVLCPVTAYLTARYTR